MNLVPPIAATAETTTALETAAEPEVAAAEVRRSFEDFYGAEWAKAVQLAYLLLGSNDRAEEVAQEAFVALHRRWDTIEHPSSYLRTAVVNRSRDRFRQRGRWKDREHLLVTDAERSEGAGAVDATSVELLDALRSLPPRQRSAVVLRYWGGMTTNEIADVLGVRPGTVKSLVHRALATLRELEGLDR